MLIHAPLLKWYVRHGARVIALHQTIDYRRGKPFTWFVEQVTQARRTGDKSKALFVDVLK